MGGGGVFVWGLWGREGLWGDWDGGGLWNGGLWGSGRSGWGCVEAMGRGGGQRGVAGRFWGGPSTTAGCRWLQ